MGEGNKDAFQKSSMLPSKPFQPWWTMRVSSVRIESIFDKALDASVNGSYSRNSSRELFDKGSHAKDTK